MSRLVVRTLRAGYLCVAFLVTFACTTPIASAAGEPVDLERFRGKVVLLDFWASWCAPCRQSFPWLNQMHAKYKDRGLVVIGINVDPERKDAERFLEETPADFEIVYDPNGSLAARYQVPGMPSSYLIGPDGQVAGVHVGFRSGVREEREAELQRLLPAASGRDQSSK
jgi:cytochrome c biogenesis protein CcmG/thiol:disulfide interchange protein DsbE